MAENTSVIYISPSDRVIHYYANNGMNTVHETKDFKSSAFDGEFYGTFANVLEGFARKYTPTSAADTTIVLPDEVIFTDLISFPAMKKPVLKSALETALSGNYKNKSELKINAVPVLNNKQFAAYSINGVRAEIITQIKRACTQAKFIARNITFAANATVCGASVLNGKLKNQTYMLMDIKEDYTRIVYSYKGRAIAFTRLPFGYRILDIRKTAAEDLLLEHPTAELAVINAREKAKAKALTMMGENTDAVNAAEGTESESSFSGTDGINADRSINQVKVLPKKTARKLPKFMQREAPTDEESTVYENFRIFEKWALCYIAGNDKLTAMGAPVGIYVNMPRRYNFLYDKVKAEEAENKIKFISLGLDREREEISRNLELYGGSYARKMFSENRY